ncbi:MAG: translation initiation factor IF-2 subunit beta [Candidatus Pacearchaeota archaeon]|jgi:translation initiation factor 2 subunit 2
MENYEQLLNKAYSQVKQVEHNGDRFEIPKAEGHFEGKRTILTNFSQVSSYLRRDPEHFLKFLLKELATSGQRDGDRLILNNTVPSKKINQKIEQYTEEFVLCKECNKPDTEIVKEDKLSVLRCLACGAKHPIRSKI